VLAVSPRLFLRRRGLCTLKRRGLLAFSGQLLAQLASYAASAGRLPSCLGAVPLELPYLRLSGLSVPLGLLKLLLRR
jgi:hypothetical protein